MRRTREQIIWDFVQSWLRKAEGDLRACEHLLSVEEEDYFASAFHAHQAAEKFLKAFLVRHQIPFRKTHDIQQLLQLASRADPSIRRELASAESLTPFGVEYRYPGEEIADIETAKGSFQQAKIVRSSILERLQEYLAKGRPQIPRGNG
ncbi:MAG: HEPN domain-containing protein [Candidatus Binatia bacterium]